MPDQPMSKLTNLPALILDRILADLSGIYLAASGGNLTAARNAAQQMLAAYRPETLDELHLAAEVISFSAHALEALAHATAPDIALAKILRLRGSAVSLSREAHKSHRKLDLLQKARRAETPKPRPEAAAVDCQTARPTSTHPPEPVQASSQATPAAAITWTKGYQQRQAAKRIAANLRKNQAAATPTNAPGPANPASAMAG